MQLLLVNGYSIVFDNVLVDEPQTETAALKTGLLILAPLASPTPPAYIIMQNSGYWCVKLLCGMGGLKDSNVTRAAVATAAL